jgi:hypothetical protein
MLEFNKEYYNNNCYFLIKEGKNKIIVFYTVGDTLTESRKNDSRMDFDKKHEKEVKENISKFLKQKKKLSKDYITKKFEKIKDGELDELVDSDATMLGSNVPILDQGQSSNSTMDQRINTARIIQDPFRLGYRVYWGESEDEKSNTISETDVHKNFGWDETEYLDYDETVETLEDMGVENPEERANEFGKDPKLEKGKVKGAFIKQRLSEKEKIEEEKKQMLKMVEDILTKKNKDKSDIIEKEQTKPIDTFLKKNIESIKKIAKKEGVSINDIIKALKNNE